MRVMLPYVNSATGLTRLLDKISDAATPDKLTHEYAKTKLHLGSSTLSSSIPFLKRMGFLTSDNAPTDLYKQFRGAERGKSLAKGLRNAYKELYEVKENVHELSDSEFKQFVIQNTGEDKDSAIVKCVCATFKVLKNLADFSVSSEYECPGGRVEELEDGGKVAVHSALNALNQRQNGQDKSFNLSYTINLNLPSTDNPAIYKAIFQSLRETLLDG